jgi:hypothetical protein
MRAGLVGLSPQWWRSGQPVDVFLSGNNARFVRTLNLLPA